jgi:anti-sigma factor RsiW
MDCDKNSVALGAYLDDELPPNEATVMREHVGSCPKCAAQIAEIVRIKSGLRAARARFTPSPQFRRVIEQQIRRPVRRPWRSYYFPAAALAAAVLLIVVASILFLRRPDGFVEIADLHINALASTNPVDVVSTDRHTVKPWFQGKIPFSFNVPEFAGTEFTLLGGRVVYFQQRPGAQLIVAVRQHKISVLIFQDAPELDRVFAVPSAVTRHNNFGVETWQLQGLRFFVIGDADVSAINRLAQDFQSANQ